jgi:pimeloyl-ACP methyl ester carboxylesterase
MKYFGKGDITVIFECGMGMDLTTWRSIEDSVASFAKVFMYDRLGLGQSGPTSHDRTIPNMVCELKALLDHEDINPPYILVPHSMGGYIARYFINQFPDDVKGLLLLDPSAETHFDSLSPDEQRLNQEFGNNYYKTQPIGTQNEWKSFLLNRKYIWGLQIPNNIPVILVSTNSWNMTPSQSMIIENHPNAKHIILEGRHDVYNVYPDSIIGFIKELANNPDL